MLADTCSITKKGNWYHVPSQSGRGLSVRASNRRAAYRSRHLRTVGRVKCRWTAMTMLVRPAARTTRVRVANRWAEVGRLAQSVGLPRSSSVSVIG